MRFQLRLLRPRRLVMKRTPMPRATKPLRRYTELRRTSLVGVGASGGLRPAGGGFPRCPRPRVSSHRLPVDVSLLVRARSGGWCEIQLAEVCLGRASQRHHRVTQKAGGRHGAAARRSDQASDLLDLCAACHDVVTDYPLRAYRYGWSLREGQETTQEPVVRCGVLVYLDDAGAVHDFEMAGA